MEIVWLEDFLVLTRTLNFTRAAEIRCLTQPAFSRRIQKLEQWLGVSLIDRSTYPATLTADGERFKDVAKDILRTISDERRLYQESSVSGRDSFIVFSMVHTIAISIYPDWIRSVEAHVGALQTRVINSSTQDCVEALIGGNVDFYMAFVHPAWPLLLDETQYPSVRLGSDRLVPVCAARPDGSPSYCLDTGGDGALPYLECAPNTITAKMVEVILQSKRKRPPLRVCYRNTMSAALKAMALTGAGLTWVPECLVANELAAGQLALAGDESWMLPMDLRLYRSAKITSPEKEVVWQHCKSVAT